jgi:hypothetical protein
MQNMQLLPLEPTCYIPLTGSGLPVYKENDYTWILAALHMQCQDPEVRKSVSCNKNNDLQRHESLY